MNAGTATITFTPRLVHDHRGITIRIQSDNGNRDRLQCGLSANKLAAFMLSIGFREVQAEYAVRPDPSRSPMALSRRDVGRRGRHTDAEGSFTETVAQFHARWAGYDTNRQMHLYSDDRRLEGPARAFFHPGVGLWQLDDAGNPDDGWVALNHGQRADTGLGSDGVHDSDSMDSGGEAVAYLLAKSYCENSGGVGGVGMKMRQWHACKPLKCIEVYNRIYLDDSDDLYVTVSQDEGSYSTAGGVSTHSCHWAVGGIDGLVPAPFGCFFYDTKHPQGWIDAGITSTTARPPDDGGLGSSPLALPFVAFSDDQKRFAVFPDKVLYPSDDSVDSTRYKAAPKTENARGEANTWSTGAYGGAVLQMLVCDEPAWVIAGGDRCGWVSADDARFASLTGAQDGS
ncbi:hypothetical protein [Candidatus Poriferisodalis sp.]|uniref:hypothetical protein n=1 Tax=Candidatus Poriferisodalis sp. TaxID=3101277 RepID=UPI003AF43D7A